MNSFFLPDSQINVNKARDLFVKAFEKTEKLMVKLVVEQFRQLILTHHSRQQLRNLWNGDGLNEDKQIKRRKYESVNRQDCVYLEFIKLFLFRVDTHLQIQNIWIIAG